MQKPKKRRGPTHNYKPEPEPPDWFVESDYTWLSGLGVRGWYDELRRLRELSIKHNLGLHTDDPKVETLGAAGGPRVLLPGAPVAQFVDAQADDVSIPKHLLPALVINISASDVVIRAEFERALAQAREKYPAPFRKSGPSATNSDIDERVCASWVKWRIVELAELLVWRAGLDAQEAKGYPKRLLGVWLGFEKSDTSKAEKVLRKAIASLPAIAAQLKYDQDPARRADYEREAQEAEDPEVIQVAANWAKGM